MDQLLSRYPANMSKFDPLTLLPFSMNSVTKSFSFVLGLCLAASASQAALPVATPVAKLPFVANRGQWEKQVKYAVAIPNGRLYLENNCFTYSFMASTPHCPTAAEAQMDVPGHAFRVTMVGAAATPTLAGEEEQTTFHNYFLGNDPAKWASSVPLYAGVRYHEAYRGIDVRWHQQEQGQLEYDFEVQPGAQPAAIRLRYDGLDGLRVTPEGHLQLRTSLGELREQAPVAWQLSATGGRRPVPCRFVLKGNEVSFALGYGYNPAERLVIDPILVFATYSGSPGGMSANTTVTDAQGNMYTGGYVLGDRYPVTLGAIKSVYKYGNIGISKLSGTGSALIYATYLGGNGGPVGNAFVDDYPLDFEMNAAGELLVLGASTSVDYPTTAGAFDRTLGDGSGAIRDLVITRLNATGTAILASTFLGGSGEEAGGTSMVPAGVALDPGGDVLVVSATRSVNYPVLNAQQPNSAGTFGYDGVVTRLNSGLTALRWSTYLGGTFEDRVHDVKVAPNGDVYVCGMTSSTNLPVGTGGVLPTAPGGTNGFVVRYSATGAQLSGTYLGGSANDAARFLDFDAGGQVLVGGATEGAYPRTAGTFGAVVAGTTGVFVHALSPALNTTLYSTQISVAGSGQLSSSNVITGFGRDNCGRLYFSAYAGSIGSVGCPLTPDAFSAQPRALYLGVLADGATALLYGTYIGELNSSSLASFNTHLHFAAANQVTRAGTLYHITCNTGRGFGTTPGAFSSGQAISNDGAAFKFDLAPSPTAGIQLAVVPPALGCAPYAVQFVNNTSGVNTYSWDFGDGFPLDTAKAPRHTYANPGAYTARLVATRRTNIVVCGAASNTVNVPITVSPAPLFRRVVDSLDCGRLLVLDPTRLTPFVSGVAYRWSTGEKTPAITVTGPGIYRVDIEQGQVCPAVVEYTIKLSQQGNIPNILTANGDALNAYLKVPSSYGVPRLKVYNRWGAVVYESTAYHNDWAGNGLPAGVYYYLMTQPNCDVKLKGWVEIVR